MKKFLMSTIALLIATVAVFGASAPEVTFMPIPAEKKFSMTINDLREPAKIKLQDESGIILLQEQAKTTGNYSKVYNLSNLPNGTYFMSIRTSTKETVQPVKLTTRGVEVDKSKRKDFFSPVIRSTEDHVDVSLYNGKIADVNVSILDAGQNVVFEESLENVILVQKRYSTKKLMWGSYTMVIETANDVYRSEFQVR